MRVLVVGTSGAGKTTFAAELAAATHSPCIELDALHWGPQWVAVPTADFRQAVDQASAGPHWVADGNYSAVRDVLWPRATHVVWLNYGRWTVCGRVLSRTLGRVLRRTELFHGNRESLRMALLSRDSILLWSWTSFARNRRKFAALRADPSYAHLQWTELTHPSQAQAWIEQHTAQRTAPGR